METNTRTKSTVTFRRYVVTDVDDGFHITNRKHPLDVDGAPEWLIDFVYENCRLKRRPITVIRDGLAFQHDGERWVHRRSRRWNFDGRFSLVDYYGLIDEIAAQLMFDWIPPDVADLDEHIDKGPPEHREWRGIRHWALGRTAASINKMIYDKWKALRDSADPVALAVQKKVFSSAFGFGNMNLVISPEFYKHPFIVKDVLANRAAAAAAGIVGRFAYGSDGIAETLEWMSDWKAIFSPTGETYPALNKTVANLPAGVPAQLLSKLSEFVLPRPITSRLELLTVIRAHFHEQRNIRVFSYATEADIAEAMRRVSLHLRVDLSPRRWRDVDQAIMFIGDYPDVHSGNIVGLAEHSIRWHRDRQTEMADRAVAEFGQGRKVAKPPIPLPVLEGVRFLASVGDVVQEGVEMQHCIASYAVKAVNGLSYLFHVDHGGEQATVEVDWCGHVIQAFGPKNVKNAASELGRKLLSKWGRGLKTIAEC